jgi:hypothetical protein
MFREGWGNVFSELHIPRLTSCAEILIQQGVPLAGGVHSDDMS